jgi:hypothetical protein
MFIFGIDPGKKNIGLCLLSDNIIVYASKHDHTENLCSIILNLMKEFQILKNNVVIVIERQKHISFLTNFVSYLRGYFDAKSIKNYLVNAPSKGLKIERYKDRKQYSINACYELLHAKKLLLNEDYIFDEIFSDERIHDICDSIMIAYQFYLSNL